MLRGIEPAPAGEPEVEVTFHVDQDGILSVTARDTRTGTISEITITDSLRLSEEEIQTHIKEAQQVGRVDPGSPPQQTKEGHDDEDQEGD